MSNQSFIPGIIPPESGWQKTQWFAFMDDKLLVYKEDGEQLIPVLDDFANLGLIPLQQQYLGQQGDTLCFSVALPAETTPPAGMTFQNLRQIFPRSSKDFLILAGRALQIMNWDRNHQFCGRCGHLTERLSNERAKECPACGLRAYPRISPSMIVLISRRDEVLLARGPTWPPGMYSVLAGFVEPGETIEQAVEREVEEEVGLLIKNITYFGSQPWPFPNSLMIAFMAEYAGGEITPLAGEIEDAGWYRYNNLPSIPPKVSIARYLIDAFVTRHTEGY